MHDDNLAQFDIAIIQNERDALLRQAQMLASEFMANADKRSVAPTPESVDRLAFFDAPLSNDSASAKQVLRELDEYGSPATMLTISPRFFGFVTGGCLPVTVASQWLAAAWDQVPNMSALSPIGCKLERVVERWIVDILGLPTGTRCSLVTGTTTANIVCLLGARQEVLQRHGWDVFAKGLRRAPRVRIILSESVHTTMLRAFRVLGFGTDDFEFVPVNDAGVINVDSFPELSNGPAIVCLAAGNVNTGAFDDFKAIIRRAKRQNAWVHVDGAFGLWAAASATHKHLVDGADQADSWATDAHKWLNVPYDSGIALFRNDRPLKHAIALSASYLVQDSDDPMNTTLEASRRARAVEIWAALRSLGRNGVAALIDKSCALARLFAERLKAAGHTVWNKVELNQVLVSFDSDEHTEKVIRLLREDGTAWFSGTKWAGKSVMRISVTCWSTTSDDVDATLAAIQNAVTRARHACATS